ncbi:unnamed protein product [Ranitomeya imitator]|uniref:Charged multivesicular body protein 7 n=1 Tax=Ranitomeya imitator TaxID=111125 RepID=A0ABN9MC43_9NEOB|nr:unnamed protein product [Ranitomeya imitator]
MEVHSDGAMTQDGGWKSCSSPGGLPLDAGSSWSRLYPPEWDDNERMSFLFSTFKQSRDVDSADWDSKMAFWSSLIVKHAKARGFLSITLRQLQTDFTRKGSIPLGLGNVVQEMLRQGSLQRESDFVAGITSGWVSWGMRQLVVNPLRWTLSSVLGGQVNLDEPFVVPEVLKVQADLVLQKYQSSALSTVLPLVVDLIPGRSTFQLVLLQLLKDKKVCLLQRDGERLTWIKVDSTSVLCPCVNHIDMEKRRKTKELSEDLRNQIVRKHEQSQGYKLFIDMAAQYKKQSKEALTDLCEQRGIETADRSKDC